MKLFFVALTLLLCSACSNTKDAGQLQPIPEDATAQEFATHIAATCAGFAKSGHENGHGTQLNLFNDCMSKAVEIMESKESPTP